MGAHDPHGQPLLTGQLQRLVHERELLIKVLHLPLSRDPTSADQAMWKGASSRKANMKGIETHMEAWLWLK